MIYLLSWIGPHILLRHVLLETFLDVLLEHTHQLIGDTFSFTNPLLQGVLRRFGIGILFKLRVKMRISC